MSTITPVKGPDCCYYVYVCVCVYGGLQGVSYETDLYQGDGSTTWLQILAIINNINILSKYVLNMYILLLKKKIFY